MNAWWTSDVCGPGNGDSKSIRHCLRFMVASEATDLTEVTNIIEKSDSAPSVLIGSHWPTDYLHNYYSTIFVSYHIYIFLFLIFYNMPHEYRACISLRCASRLTSGVFIEVFPPFRLAKAMLSFSVKAPRDDHSSRGTWPTVQGRRNCIPITHLVTGWLNTEPALVSLVCLLLTRGTPAEVPSRIIRHH